MNYNTDRKIILVDETTGEKIGDYTPRKAKSKHYHYYLVFYSGYAQAMGDIRHVLIGQMDADNKLTINAEKIRYIADNYKVKPSAVKMLMTRMTRDGLIMRISQGNYFVNPYYFTKTNIRKLESLRKEYSELLFSTCQKAKKETPTQKEAKRVRGLEKQINDIIKK